MTRVQRSNTRANGIDVVLFDVMGTLVHDPFYEEMPAFFEMTFDAWIAAKNPSNWVPFEHGARGEREVLSEFFSDGRAFDHAEFLRMLKASYRYLDGIEPLLQELSRRGIKMHTFSNYPCWYRLIEEALGVSRYVEWTFVSCETRLRKPDPAAYRHVVERLGIPAERCLFVDDRKANVDAALGEGMQGLVFEGGHQLRARLIELGVL